MKLEHIVFIAALITLLIFGITRLSTGAPNSFRSPTPTEMLQGLKAGVIKDLTGAMIKSEQIGKIETAMNMPCAKVWVSSKVVNGFIYYGIEANVEECQ